MAQSSSASSTCDTFRVVFQAEFVHCHCMDDAVAIKNANHLVNDHVGYVFSWREMNGMAEVLARYGRADAAETLRRQSLKLRAAQFLLDSIGYVRIARSAQS